MKLAEQNHLPISDCNQLNQVFDYNSPITFSSQQISVFVTFKTEEVYLSTVEFITISEQKPVFCVPNTTSLQCMIQYEVCTNMVHMISN